MRLLVFRFFEIEIGIEIDFLESNEHGFFFFEIRQSSSLSCFSVVLFLFDFDFDFEKPYKNLGPKDNFETGSTASSEPQTVRTGYVNAAKLKKFRVSLVNRIYSFRSRPSMGRKKFSPDT